MRTMVLVVVSLVGCGIPADVVKVDRESPHQGARYILKRPVLRPFLRYVKAAGAGRWHFKLVLEQTLEETGDVYEVRPNGRLFSSTNVSVSMTSKGALQAFTAGEDDKTGEFVAAVSSLVLTAASIGISPAATVPTPDRELPFELQRYVGDHTEKLRDLEMVKAAIEVVENKIASNPTSYKSLFDDLEELEAERARRTKKVRASLFPLDEKLCHVLVSGTRVYGDAEADPWVIVELN